MDRSQPVFRKIKERELNKLKPLFPEDIRLWPGYRNARKKQLREKERDIFVIDSGREFIGEVTVLYKSHRLPQETVPGQRAYLAAFRVKKDLQGQGLGQMLLEYTMASLRAEGYTQFTIGVEEDNERAKHIYFKHGFTKPVGTARGNNSGEYTLYLKED